jgi:small GTP-binding protein
MEKPAHPDAKYKVVIVGDAGVGKTTLLQRFQAQVQRPSDYTDGTPYEVVHDSTLGVDYLMVTIQVRLPDGTSVCVRLELHDTAGSERFGTMVGSYMRNCDAILYAFRCAPMVFCGHDENTARESLLRLQTYWAPFARQYGAMGREPQEHQEDSEYPISLLVGTQWDVVRGKEARAMYLHTHTDLLHGVLTECCWPPPPPLLATALQNDDDDDSVWHTAVHWTSGRTGEGVAELFETLARRLWEHRPPLSVSHYITSTSTSGIRVSSSAGGGHPIISTQGPVVENTTKRCCADGA